MSIDVDLIPEPAISHRLTRHPDDGMAYRSYRFGSANLDAWVFRGGRTDADVTLHRATFDRVNANDSEEPYVYVRFVRRVDGDATNVAAFMDPAEARKLRDELNALEL